MEKCITYVGLDVHKNSIDVALADEGRDKEVRYYGTIDGSLDALDKVLRKLVSRGTELRFVYEAGPCGYDIYRHLTRKGFDCIVVAPSLIPKKSGSRIKNDRRDAEMLARLHRAGELTPVYVPRIEDEAMRDLCRARIDAKNAERKARQQLNAFLLRSGFRYSGKTLWSLAHWRWISDIHMTHSAQQITLQEYVDAVRSNTERVDRITEQICLLAAEWRLGPVVEALQALRGVSLVVASTTVAELGDLSRFDNPRHLMAYLGLVPSEHSSGESTQRGGITKTGNGHARRMLVEAAWSYRLPARVSRRLRDRQQNLPQAVWEIAWKAQLRLCARYKRLVTKGKQAQVVITAIARELSAFMWAIAQAVPVAS
ncbi:IS110 family RNA-guided transposase [Trichlorobacter lovleyi]|uniref:Transposase IS116/IS110/IS902 family protein n=1 Tax=Trichlorobacter lovleyi (strain ATCC BAA-1151 / DSM 17278 / SZ) TaxID=398767 RepID=B3E2B4_TRIL1|nr:IS110 family transposase [Trichlorobacter lovleyi]ACD94167.1 transposase IS116/IS110/IS902 family protein [Trichlorobacter lovleyi SZ]ACD94914.1 transposase IS116/IS110/IS902 family protein [Trichlorobacter lovleyi SZ]ACD95396.1 transposase IS116/IS110/IS902 family protein [Trichlorobacter lovleyi SZ]